MQSISGLYSSSAMEINKIKMWNFIYIKAFKWTQNKSDKMHSVKAQRSPAISLSH